MATMISQGGAGSGKKFKILKYNYKLNKSISTGSMSTYNPYMVNTHIVNGVIDVENPKIAFGWQPQSGACNLYYYIISNNSVDVYHYYNNALDAGNMRYIGENTSQTFIIPVYGGEEFLFVSFYSGSPTGRCFNTLNATYTYWNFTTPSAPSGYSIELYSCTYIEETDTLYYVAGYTKASNPHYFYVYKIDNFGSKLSTSANLNETLLETITIDNTNSSNGLYGIGTNGHGATGAGIKKGSVLKFYFTDVTRKLINITINIQNDIITSSSTTIPTNVKDIDKIFLVGNINVFNDSDLRCSVLLCKGADNLYFYNGKHSSDNGDGAIDMLKFNFEEDTIEDNGNNLLLLDLNVLGSAYVSPYNGSTSTRNSYSIYFNDMYAKTITMTSTQINPTNGGRKFFTQGGEQEKIFRIVPYKPTRIKIEV